MVGKWGAYLALKFRRPLIELHQLDSFALARPDNNVVLLGRGCGCPCFIAGSLRRTQQAAG